MHLPWRKEEELHQGFDSAEEAFQHKNHLLQKPPTNQHAEDIARAVKQIQSLEDKVIKNHIAPMVIPNIDALNNDLLDSSKVIRDDPDNSNLFEISSQLDEEIQDNGEVNTVLSGMDEDAHMNHLKFNRLSDTDYDNSIQCLNKAQQDVFSTVQKYFNDLRKYTPDLTVSSIQEKILYISQLIRFARVCSHIDDFNTRNKCLTAEHLKQGYRYHKLRKAFSKFYRGHYELISKYNVGLKSLLHQGLSEPEFYGELVYKFKKIRGMTDFSDQN